MKLFPEIRRNSNLLAAFYVWIVLACGLPLLSGLLSAAGWPRLSEIVFGNAALILLSAVVSAAALVVIGRLRPESVLAAVLPILLSAGVTSLLLDLSGWWNDGSAYLVLRPSDALFSILTLCLVPFRSGPTALIRFWPLLVALGIIWRARPFKLLPIRVALAAGVSYLILAFSVHALSWIAVLLSLVRKTSFADLSDMFRLLVSAQSGGYWIASQSERFAAPLGRQAETGLAASQSAVWFLLTCAILLALAASRTYFLKLAKRLLTMESLPILFTAGIGLGVGTVFGAADHSYTYWFSFLIFAVAAIAWTWRERLRQDFENLPEDELERPHLPLPSGAVAAHEIEFLELVLAGLAFFGALLLGWTVLVGFIFAEGVAWMRSRRGLAWGTAVVSNAGAQLLMALALGFSGLAFGLRGFAVMPWQMSAIVSAALLAAGLMLLRCLDKVSESHAVRAFLPSGIMLLALAILRQPAIWGFGVLAAAGQVVIGWRDEWFVRFRFLPILLLLMTIAILALIWPVMWRSF